MDLNLSPNLFLEINELNRFKKSLRENGYQLALKYLSKSFGIATNSNNSFFKVSQKGDSENVVIVNAGIAFDNNVNPIILAEDKEITINTSQHKQWLVLEYASTHDEEGTVSISSTGVLSGYDTKFLDVLRGQVNYPTKVKFTSTNNPYDYEVVDVTSDTVATLSGSFVAESNLKYQVIGCFTPGFQPTDEDKLIYTYDSCSISVIESDSKPVLDENQFLIGSIDFNLSGAMEVNDERIYNMFGEPYQDNNGNIITKDTDELASLLSTQVISVDNQSITLEMILESGYNITKYEYVTTSSSNIINIINGNSNYLGTGDIENGRFAGWLLLNRSNMKSAIITTNENKSLYLSNYNSELLDSDVIDLVIIPNFREIEFEVQVSNNVAMPSVPFYFRKSLYNLYTRIHLELFFKELSETFTDEVEVKVHYRMIGTEKEYSFKNLAIAQFTNVNNEKETLGGSSFKINVTSFEPEEEQRNYS